MINQAFLVLRTAEATNALHEAAMKAFGILETHNRL